jgi:hypothetical protein
MASFTNDHIAAAVAALGSQEPAWAERYQSAARLLSNGGWQRTSQFVTFPGGIVTQPGACSCQEGQGPIICLHRVALAILDQADLPSCTDCDACLTDDTIARIGTAQLTICRTCRAARVAAGRQRQIAADWAAVAPC